MSESTGKSLQPGDLPSETLSNRLEELNRRIVSSVETAVQGLNQDLSSFASEAGSSGRKMAAGSLLEAFARIDGEGSQSEILTALLEECRRFASRTAFFLLRPNQIVAWASRGFGDSDNTLAGRSIEGGGPWDLLAEGGGALSLDADACATICQGLGAEPGVEAILIPFVIRGQLGGALYADQLASQGSLLTEALQLLAHSASQAVELVAVSHRGTSPALRRGEGQEAASLPVWQPSSTSETAAPEAVAAPEGIHAEAAGAATAAAAEPSPSEDLTEAPPLDETSAPATATDDAMVGDGMVGEDMWQGDVVEDDDDTSFDMAPEPAMDIESEPTFAEPEILDEPESPTVEAAAESEPTFAEPEILDGPEPVFAEPEPTFAEPETFAETEPSVLAEPTFTDAVVDDDPAFAETATDSPVDFDTPDLDFEEEDPTAVDLTNEVVPEPELEDTSTDIWSLEEEEVDDDDEPTMVGMSVDSLAAAAPMPVPPEPAPPLAVDSVGQETVRLDIAALQGRAASFASAEPATPEPVAPEPTPAVPEPPPQPTAPKAASFAQPQSAYVPPPAVASEDPTVVAPPPAPSFTDPVSSGGFVPPPEPKVEASAAGASNEVRPPEGHQGPGLAFSSAPGSDDALHEEARRLARLLVSEIKLYNEEIIEEGKRQGDIYGRLRDDIDRSRQMYQERIDPKLQGKDDYFYQELVQRLAGGDAKLLGMG